MAPTLADKLTLDQQYTAHIIQQKKNFVQDIEKGVPLPCMAINAFDREFIDYVKQFHDLDSKYIQSWTHRLDVAGKGRDAVTQLSPDMPPTIQSGLQSIEECMVEIERALLDNDIATLRTSVPMWHLTIMECAGSIFDHPITDKLTPVVLHNAKRQFLNKLSSSLVQYIMNKACDIKDPYQRFNIMNSLMFMHHGQFNVNMVQEVLLRTVCHNQSSPELISANCDAHYRAMQMTTR